MEEPAKAASDPMRVGMGVDLVRITIGGQDIELPPGTRLKFEGIVTILPPQTAASKEDAAELTETFKPIVNVEREQFKQEIAEDRRNRLLRTPPQPNYDDMMWYLQTHPGFHNYLTSMKGLMQTVKSEFSDQDLWNLMSTSTLPVVTFAGDLSYVRAELRKKYETKSAYDEVMAAWDATKMDRTNLKTKVKRVFDSAIQSLSLPTAKSVVTATRASQTDTNIPPKHQNGWLYQPTTLYLIKPASV